MEGDLEEIDDGVWCLQSHFVAWGCNGSLRMTIIKTSSGLLIYSPVRLGPRTIEEVHRLGHVATIVAPNLFHHIYLRYCIDAFPDARVLVPDGLERKIGAIPRAEVTTQATAIDAFGGIEHHVVTGHVLRETVLFHVATRTLITADLLYNYQREHYPAEKAFFRLIGCYGAPKVAFYHRFAISKKGSIGRLIDQVRSWAPRRIIMCHGRIIEAEDAGELFADAWQRLS